MLAAAAVAPAQNKDQQGAKGDPKAGKNADGPDGKEKLLKEWGAVPGPTVGRLSAPGKGVIAEVKVPAGQVFIGQPGAAKFANFTRNPGGQEWAGVILLDSGGFIVFEYLDIGHIKDADKEKLDADKQLADMKASDAEQNRQRKAQGFPTLTVEGWATPPFYDPQTKNLTWAINVKGESGRTSVNHQVHLLSREGTMHATLACGPDDYPKAKGAVNPLLAGFSFTPGNTYAEWKPGDKVAEYGLAGLIAGGAVFGAAKLGLLAKLGKLGKPLIVGVIVIVAGIGKLFSSLLGRRRKSVG